MCVCVSLLMTVAGGQVRVESEAIGDMQRRKPSQTQHWLLSFLSFSPSLSLTAGKQTSPSPPWQSELRQVIPPSTAKSFTSPTQPWMLLHKANAVWACVLVCVHVQSMPFDLQAHTQINGRGRLLMCPGCREKRWLVCCSASLSHSLGGRSICARERVNDNQCVYHDSQCVFLMFCIREQLFT